MRRIPTLNVLACLSLAGAVIVGILPGASAASAPGICDGRPATITGTPGQSLTGTDGDDVVVTNGATSVSTGDGDDTVCLTGDAPVTTTTGEDDDVVDATDGDSPGPDIDVDLGAGDDRYVAGASVLQNVDAGVGDDQVRAGRIPAFVYAVLGPGSDLFDSQSSNYNTVFAGERAAKRTPGADTDADVIHTGSSNDDVYSGEADLPNSDVVSTGGSFDDVYWAGRPDSEGSVDTGSGNDTMTLSSPQRQPWVIDNAAGRFGYGPAGGSATEPAMRVEQWDVDHLSWSSLTYRGRAGRDVLGNRDGKVLAGNGPVHATLGDGNDTAYWSTAWHGGLDGGQGFNFLDVVGPERFDGPPRAKSASVDLAHHRMTTDGGTTRVTDFRKLWAEYVRTEHLTGSNGPDRIYANGCSLTLHGLKGDDTIEGSHTDGCYHLPRRLHTYGDRGDDLLTGSGTRSDVLIGGRGDDTTVNPSGVGRCQAEHNRC